MEESIRTATVASRLPQILVPDLQKYDHYFQRLHIPNIITRNYAFEDSGACIRRLKYLQDGYFAQRLDIPASQAKLADTGVPYSAAQPELALARVVGGRDTTIVPMQSFAGISEQSHRCPI